MAHVKNCKCSKCNVPYSAIIQAAKMAKAELKEFALAVKKFNKHPKDCRCSGCPAERKKQKALREIVHMRSIKQDFANLTDEQRLEIMSHYCKGCGKHGTCHCWNDD